MAQKQIEVILTRQLAGYLAMPVFIVDSVGNLIYYNEPAERILGRRLDETENMPAADWATLFTPRAADGSLLAPETLPLVTALSEQMPAYLEFTIEGLDGVRRSIQVSAFPLIGLQERHLGAVAIFWEHPE